MAGVSLLNATPTSGTRTVARILLGGILAFAGISHLTFARDEFQAQVPDWVPVDDDAVVLASGLAEITLGAALIGFARTGQRRTADGSVLRRDLSGQRRPVPRREGRLGLDTDRKRLVRLFFQPVLVLWALWSTGAWRDRPTRSR